MHVCIKNISLPNSLPPSFGFQQELTWTVRSKVDIKIRLPNYFSYYDNILWLFIFIFVPVLFSACSEIVFWLTSIVSLYSLRQCFLCILIIVTRSNSLTCFWLKKGVNLMILTRIIFWPGEGAHMYCFNFRLMISKTYFVWRCQYPFPLSTYLWVNKC